MRTQDARGFTGLNQTDFAARCGLWAAAINRIESGSERNPSIATMARIADGAGVSLDYLAGRTNQRTPQRVADLATYDKETGTFLRSFLQLQKDEREKVMRYAAFIKRDRER